MTQSVLTGIPTQSVGTIKKRNEPNRMSTVAGRVKTGIQCKTVQVTKCGSLGFTIL